MLLLLCCIVLITNDASLESRLCVIGAIPLHEVEYPMPDLTLGSDEWWNEYQQTVNDDQEMNVRGHDAFDENFFVQIDDDRFVVEMYGGEVQDVVANPGVNGEYSFGVTGSREAWEEFVQEIPPAHNNEIIASDYRTVVRGDEGHLQLHGNNKKVFQNLRPFQRALELMRETQNSREQ